MKNLLLPFFVFLLTTSVHANNKRELIPEYTIESSTVDSSLSGDQAVFVIIVDGEYFGNAPESIIYSIQDDDHIVDLDDKNSFEIKTVPGEHTMHFAIDNNHNEISIRSIQIQPGYRTIIRLNFRAQDMQIELKKPVVYLYPEQSTNVTMQIEASGQLTFMYPTYNETWEVIAHPDGTIEHNGNEYKYLFWEADHHNTLTADFNEGFAVEKARIIPFLEESLNQFGFNDQERQDFITYWGPKMIQHAGCMVHFVLNDACDQFAELHIEPKPKNVNRFYMLWAPVDNVDDFNYIHPQKIQSISRLGFTVLEWGGAQISATTMQNKAL